ncbi:hypothetical protein TcasGA2_TC033220 [Tribolium castaneum]|uniref:Uncharacterized protein n=1 Tax=Tribolium castaneum TaxID=7070 RepID=A0A139WHP8_TRICA|nr:hypothetical protein TcasGA2_TC033220 [Tribolium castaneum]
MCRFEDNCESPKEITCPEDSTYCLAIRTYPDKNTFYVTSRGCASPYNAEGICKDIKEMSEGNCYNCQEDLCNEKLPELE